MTFLIDNETTLQEAVQKAESLKQFLEQNFPTENGLPLRLSPVKKLKVTETKYHQIFHKALPPRRRKTKKSTPFTIDLTNVGDEMAQVSTNVQNQENEKKFKQRAAVIVLLRCVLTSRWVKSSPEAALIEQQSKSK
ncbi:uncharacterized protein LOC124434209 [Xenia sp. Carnegie-2017]|uniref:uncharacterized protein LOC124434209 n=1 Tax=Xenia sp. Carnegie-2017 TaxID=2897299 RepID=UPI001F04B6C8|nr:uncharacterized protein LOC124434209 [Xenia sp. Carnegie-2017]